MLTHLTRRTPAPAALVLALALVGPVVATTAPAPAAAHPAGVDATTSAKAPTTGRFVTTSKKGIVLVDEDGRHRHTIIPAKRRSSVQLEQADARTGTLLHSSRGDFSQNGRRRTWHVANLFGVELGTFRAPAHVTPAVDSGGFHAFWVEIDADSTNLVTLQVGDPDAKPTLVRELELAGGGNVSVSPDDRFVAVSTYRERGLGGHLSIVAADGSAVTDVPVPAGQTYVWFDPVWAPDSSRVTFQTQTDPYSTSGTDYALWTSAPEGDSTPVFVARLPWAAFDWSPDGTTILGGVRDSPELVSLDLTTGQSTRSRLSGRDAVSDRVFWSGLKAGAVPRDRKRPSLRIAPPDCGDRSPAACARYRQSVAAWRVVTGRVRDRGRSGLRYVAVAAIQLRGQDWWALVAAPDAKHGVWRRFPNRGEAKWHAKERTARFAAGRWRVALPGLTSGRLVVVAMAVDGVGNETERLVAKQLR